MPDVWAGIVRVSHVGGRGGDSFHADRDQVDEILRYAKAHGARVEILPPELSVSGGRPIEDRPSLLAAIEGVESGRYTGIVVAYLSRLSRSRSGLQIWERVEAAGGHVHCAAENLDTSTPSGRFVRDIHLANAVREREEHVARFDVRRRLATQAGIWQRRQFPLGYRRDPDTRKLVPDGQADRVRAAFRLRADGAPMVQVAEFLRMSPAGARYLLKNRVYLGELKVGEYVNPAAHPAIVDVELFDVVQGTQGARSALRREERALLAGLVRCQGCGHVMSRARSKVVVYGCHVRHSAGRCRAPAAITLRLLDDHVERVVLGELARLRSDVVRDDGALVRARAEVAAAEQELRAFLEAVTAANIDPDDFAKAAGARRERLEEARRDLGKVGRAQAPERVEDPVGFWEGATVQERHAVLRSLVESVIVRRAGGRGRQVAVHDRVRVIRFGAGMVLPGGPGGIARAVEPIGFPDGDDEVVLGVPGVE